MFQRDKFLLVVGFEKRVSVFGGDRSTDCATTTVLMMSPFTGTSQCPSEKRRPRSFRHSHGSSQGIFFIFRGFGSNQRRPHVPRLAAPDAIHRHLQHHRILFHVTVDVIVGVSVDRPHEISGRASGQRGRTATSPSRALNLIGPTHDVRHVEFRTS